MMRARYADPQFVFRSVTRGREYWICPFSGHYNVSALTPERYRLQCTGIECKRCFVPGRILYPSTRGSHSVPPDWIIPLGRSEEAGSSAMVEAFPNGDLALVPWRRHHQTHVLVDPTSADFNVELLVRSVRQLAAVGRDGDFAAPRDQHSYSHLVRLGAAFATLASGYRL